MRPQWFKKPWYEQHTIVCIFHYIVISKVNLVIFNIIYILNHYHFNTQKQMTWHIYIYINETAKKICFVENIKHLTGILIRLSPKSGLCCRVFIGIEYLWQSAGYTAALNGYMACRMVVEDDKPEANILETKDSNSITLISAHLVQWKHDINNYRIIEELWQQK